MNIERRKSSRNQPEKLIYIHLQPGNGAIILNISEQGLCFRAAGPVVETGPIRFSLSLQGNQELEAAGELVWTDATRKKGALRLTEFPADVRNPLNICVRRLRTARLKSAGLEEAFGEGSLQDSSSLQTTISLQKAAAPEAREEAVASVVANVPVIADVPKVISPQVAAEERPPVPGGNSLAVTSPVVVPSAPPTQAIVRQSAKPKLQRRMPSITSISWRPLRKWPTLSPRVMMVFAALTILAAVLVHAHASHSEHSVVYGQEPVVGESPVNQQSAEEDPGTSAQASPSLEELRAQIAALESENRDIRKVAASRTDARSLSAQADVQDDAARSDDSAIHPPEGEQTVLRALPAPPDSDSGKSVLSADATPAASAEPVADSGAADADVNPVAATYFEVGNFKDRLWANKATDDLGKLGFHAIVVHKAVLWIKSFHVVVGPFGSDKDSEAARDKLENLGFNPRMAKIH